MFGSWPDFSDFRVEVLRRSEFGDPERKALLILSRKGILPTVQTVWCRSLDKSNGRTTTTVGQWLLYLTMLIAYMIGIGGMCGRQAGSHGSREHPVPAVHEQADDVNSRPRKLLSMNISDTTEDWCIKHLNRENFRDQQAMQVHMARRWATLRERPRKRIVAMMLERERRECTRHQRSGGTRLAVFPQNPLIHYYEVLLLVSHNSLAIGSSPTSLYSTSILARKIVD